MIFSSVNLLQTCTVRIKRVYCFVFVALQETWLSSAQLQTVIMLVKMQLLSALMTRSLLCCWMMRCGWLDYCFSVLVIKTLRCFDTVGWVAGKGIWLVKISHQQSLMVQDIWGISIIWNVSGNVGQLNINWKYPFWVVVLLVFTFLTCVSFLRQQFRDECFRGIQ